MQPIAKYRKFAIESFLESKYTIWEKEREREDFLYREKLHEIWEKPNFNWETPIQVVPIYTSMSRIP